MDFLIKALAQAPLVAVIAYIWWTGRRDANQEMHRLRERMREKDNALKEFSRTFDRLTVSLELIKDRLR